MSIPDPVSWPWLWIFFHSGSRSQKAPDPDTQHCTYGIFWSGTGFEFIKNIDSGSGTRSRLCHQPITLRWKRYISSLSFSNFNLFYLKLKKIYFEPIKSFKTYSWIRISVKNNSFLPISRQLDPDPKSPCGYGSSWANSYGSMQIRIRNTHRHNVLWWKV